MALKIFIIICILAGIYFYTRSYTLETMSVMGGSSGRCPNMLIQKGAAFYLYNTKLAEVPGVNPVRFNNLEEYVEFLDWQRSQGIRCPVLYLQEVYDSQGNMTYKARPCVTEPQGGLPPTTASLDANVTQFPSRPGIPVIENNKNPYTQLPYRSEIPATENPALPDQSSIPSSSYALDPSNRYPNLERTLLIDATANDPPYNQNSYPSFDKTSFYSGKHTPLDQLDVIAESKPMSYNPMDPNWGGAEYTQYLIDAKYFKDNEVMIKVA
jgi:hypothetical protein